MTVRHFYALLVALLLPLTMQAQTRSGLHPERFDTLIAGLRVGLYVLPAFPTTTLRPGQTFRSTTTYRFGIKKR